MVDVLLTILIFFMTITSAQVLRVDKTIKLPVAPNAQKKDNSRAEGIINVRWKADDQDGRVRVRRQGVRRSPRTWCPSSRRATTRTRSIAASSAGDREAPAMAISRVMNVFGEAGISDISFSAVNKE